MVAIGLAAIIGARWSAFGTPSLRGVVGGVCAVVLPAFVVGWCRHRDRHLAAAAGVLACSSTVIVAAADGRWQGILALVVVVAAVAAAFGGRVANATLAALVAGASVLWWGSGLDNGDAPGPSWTEIAAGTGRVVRRATSSIGVDERLVPLSGVLVWWLGVGLVIGAALLAGRPRVALWVPLGVAAMVAGIWVIGLLRGPVAPLGGTWIVAGTVMLAGLGPVTEGGGGRRLANAVAVLATSAWAVAFVRELRDDSVAAAVLAGCGALVVAVALLTTATDGPAEIASPPARSTSATGDVLSSGRL